MKVKTLPIAIFKICDFRGMNCKKQLKPFMQTFGNLQTGAAKCQHCLRFSCDRCVQRRRGPISCQCVCVHQRCQFHTCCRTTSNRRAMKIAYMRVCVSENDRKSATWRWMNRTILSWGGGGINLWCCTTHLSMYGKHLTLPSTISRSIHEPFNSA